MTKLEIPPFVYIKIALQACSWLKLVRVFYYVSQREPKRSYWVTFPNWWNCWLSALHSNDDSSLDLCVHAHARVCALVGMRASAQRGQWRAYNALELELQMVVSSPHIYPAWVLGIKCSLWYFYLPCHLSGLKYDDFHTERWLSLWI